MLSSLPPHQPALSTLESTSISKTTKTKRSTTNSIHAFEQLIILKRISKAKFPVYLAKSPSSDQHLAMKVYIFKNGQPNPRFKNEARFSQLNHDNVISIVSCAEEAQEASVKISYMLMEYAPYGDFFDLVMNATIEWDDKLTRTYFHQLINGIEYLHSQGIAHMDLKLENLLMGENFTLKIADFDLSHLLVDGKVTTKGTKNYRAPDVLNNVCRDPQAADIYSAGIILFVMRCGGILPYLEGEVYKGIDLQNLMLDKPDIFWEKHMKIQKRRSNFFEQSFKSLFVSMTRADSAKRAKISEIKRSQWYQGPVYSQKELSNLMEQKWRTIKEGL